MRWLLLFCVLAACERPNFALEVELPYGLLPGDEVRLGETRVGVVKRVDRTVAPVRIEAFIEDPAALGLRSDACARPTAKAVILDQGQAAERFAGAVVPACDLGGRAVEEAFRGLRDALERAEERTGVGGLSRQLDELEAVGAGGAR